MNAASDGNGLSFLPQAVIGCACTGPRRRQHYGTWPGRHGQASDASSFGGRPTPRIAGITGSHRWDLVSGELHGARRHLCPYRVDAPSVYSVKSTPY